jgi:hypothetical protein
MLWNEWSFEMRNKRIEQALEDVFAAPCPMGKTAFLKQHRRCELSYRRLIVLQVRYVRWWVWLLSLVLSGFILITVSRSGKSALWCISALTPFFALMAITENGRAQLYQMEELELACRMSRQSAMLARMVAIGLFHLFLFTLLLAYRAVEVVQAGVYLLTPYFLTVALGLELSRRFRGRDGLVACSAVAVTVSALGPLAETVRPALYQAENLVLWGTVLVAVIMAAAAEFTLQIKRLGELQWN